MSRYRFRCPLLYCLLLILLLLCGCAHYPLNQPLNNASVNARYDFEHNSNCNNSEGTFVVLTFSGGGTMAAALAYGVLDKLRATTLQGAGNRLLDNVNIISTVSGGSFTGAYYALFGDRIFDDFKDKFLYRNVQGEIRRAMFRPSNLIRVFSPYFSRINLAAELYDNTIFESQTFGDLAKKTKAPFLIINSTSMARGTQFEFTSRQFDYLGSDILPWPIAHAVAASSAFPFLLSPISLKNYSNLPEHKISAEDQAALKEYWTNKRRYYSAKNNLLYADAEKHPYIHLIDGGISDNLGLRAIYNLFERNALQEMIAKNRIKRLLVIIVNARTESTHNIDKHESPPGLFLVGQKALTIPMNNYTFETIELFKSMLQEKIKTGKNVHPCKKPGDSQCSSVVGTPATDGSSMKLYIAELTFDNLTDQNEKDFFNKLPTSFSLEKDQVDKLIEVGGRLLTENHAFRQFLNEYRKD